MNTPITEYKLSKEGKILYYEILRMSENKTIKKIEINSKDYDNLLKGISFHRRDEYSNTMHINGKIIVRK